MEKAYSVYGEGTKGKGSSKGEGKPVEQLAGIEGELKKAIQEVKDYLQSVNFNLHDLKNAKSMGKIEKIKEAADCVCLNETTRTSFEIMARNVFRKHKALYPEEQIKPYIKDFNSIEAIYKQLNKNVKTADVTEIMMELQSVVGDSVLVQENEVTDKKGVYVDLSTLDFDKLKAAFAKMTRKNTLTYNLQQAVEKKLQQMLKENPLRLEFYERYKEIIAEYNAGKTVDNTVKVFESLNELIKDLSVEEQRACRENLGDQEALAIFDLLCEGKELDGKDIKQVKKVAKETLDKLKAEKLKIERWRESRQITAQVKAMINNNLLLLLPEHVYTDEDVRSKTVSVYQHIHSNYYGGGKSVYQ